VSAVNLGELVADLSHNPDVRTVTCDKLSRLLRRTEATRRVADFIQQIIDVLPVCPTCDGVGKRVDPADYYIDSACPDCTDGKLDVFRALARLAELEAIVAELDSLHEPLCHSPSPNSYVSCSLCHEPWPCDHQLIILRSVKP